MRCESGCGRHVLVLWARTTDNTGWAFCDPCSRRNAERLTAQGFTVLQDDRETVSA